MGVLNNYIDLLKLKKKVVDLDQEAAQLSIELGNVETLLGETDVSDIADGTLTGIASALNENLTKKCNSKIFSIGNGVTKTIRFEAFATCALLQFGVDLYLFSNGYLSPIKTASEFTVTLASDYTTITVKNNTSKTYYGGVLELGGVQFTVS